MMKKTSPLIALLMVAAFLLLQGCEEPAGVVVADKIKVQTRPQKITRELTLAGLCFGTGRPPGKLDVKLCDPSGLDVFPSDAAFDEDFAPDKLVDGKHFFSWVDDPVHFTTRLFIISRSAYKRTDVEYSHLLGIAGEPLLRDDAVMIAVGTKGAPKDGTCNLALLDLLTEKVKRVIPAGYTTEELEGATIIPVAWEGKDIHAVLFLQEGKAVYFVSDDNSNISSSINLEGTYVAPDSAPRGWRINARGSKPFLLAFESGYFLIDDKSSKATYLEFDRNTRLLGVADNGSKLVISSYDKNAKRPAIYRRYPIGGDTAPPLPFGRAGGGVAMEPPVYSIEENCIFYVDTGDIWRMDLNSGVLGKMFDTPDENEVLLWVW